MEKVKVYVKVSGYYCQFSEMSLRVIYDITNDKPTKGGWSKEEIIEEMQDDDDKYTDITSMDAIKDGDDYYVKF